MRSSRHSLRVPLSCSARLNRTSLAIRECCHETHPRLVPALSQMCRGTLARRPIDGEGPRSNRGFWIAQGARPGIPIIGGIPRFVRQESYAESFGFQWNRFRQTQLDSHSGRDISRDRFLTATGWQPESLAGKTVLDAGCGAGRFAEIALSFGATVFAVDYSRAVEACQCEFSLASQPARHAGEHLFASLSRRIFR